MRDLLGIGYGYQEDTRSFSACSASEIVPAFLMRCAPLLAAALTLLQISTGVRGASPNTVANFSAATAAAAFVGAENRTFIGCEGFANAKGADRACVSLLGHTRGQCFRFSAYGNETRVAICMCIPYAGTTPPGNCVDATCVWGVDACSSRQWQNYVVIVLHIFDMLLTAYVFGFGLYVIVAARRNLTMNSTSVTLVSMTLTAMFHLLWRVCVFLGYAVLLSRLPTTEVQQPIAIPGLTLCGVVGVLAFPLQWLEVAKKTARIKTSRDGSSTCKAPHIAVGVAACVISAAVIFFSVTDQSSLVTGEFPGLHTTDV